MKNDTPWWSIIIFTALILFIIFAIINDVQKNKCTEDKRGFTKTSRYGGPVMVCNGYEWVPYRVELPR